MLQSKLSKAVALTSVFIASLALSSTARAITPEDKVVLEQLKQSSLKSDLSYELIESLTTEVGNRLMGTEGDKRSIEWAVNKMKALGFDKVWTEEVKGTYWQRGHAHAQIVAPFPQKMVVLALGGSVSTPQGGLEAQVAHFETLADLKAAPDNSLNGKIAFVSYRMTKHIDGKGYGPAVGTRVTGASVAAQKGASALIMRSVGTDNNRTAHTGVMRYQEGIAKIPAVALSNPDADLLVNQLKRNKPVTFKLAVETITGHGQSAVSANVIGEITGSELPNEIVAIGAHLDSWDVGTGALDDGLGIGMTMAAAAQIAQLESRPKRTIRVILFAAEEVGLLGAKQYLADRKDDVSDHVLGAEWDFGMGPIYKMTPGVGANALNSIREFAQIIAPLGVSLSPMNNGVAQSDMSLLTKAGMPSVNFAPDGTDYFDYHHTENDTLDKVNPDDLKINTTIYTLFAYYAAQAPVDFRK
ncbi:M20/M25/M40 family metallo-hydrolase [Thalassotalea sp. LPB0316]|uniref:M20/M25/M40 family metallo-hydrolase n=1 Tax=Thalassotalea sp. LPB0316 TaxID=2769490 RepID=UPI001D05019A|nr:M20/M25/M40 family metallo-hydrolase [Thalassotalea sp. LPB0316]